MSANGARRFKVARLPKAKAQIDALRTRAAAVGMARDLARARRGVMHWLEDMAAQWGEPLYRTKLPGGMVRLGGAEGLSVQNIVYEEKRVVLIHSVVPLYSPFAD